MSAGPVVTVCLLICLSISPLFTEAAKTERLINIHGSDTMLILNNELAAVYNKEHPSTKFDVLGGGSGLGIKALLEGTTDIAAASRRMNEFEISIFEEHTGTRPLEIVVALDGIGIYVHNNNHISRLTVSQLRGILTGEIRNWREVGGMNRRIDVYNRDKNSGTRAFMQEHILRGKPFSSRAREVSSTSMIMACVARNQNAIGYGGIAYAEGAHIIRLANQPQEPGTWPSQENVSSGNYPLSRALYFYVNPTTPDGTLSNFIDWVLGPEGQSIVNFVGYYSAQNRGTEKVAPPVEDKPVSLTPENMKQYGFDLSVTTKTDSNDSSDDRVMLTMRFNPASNSARKIRKLMLRIGDDMDIPLSLTSDLSVEFALRKQLIEITSICLSHTESPQDGDTFIMKLSDFCSQNL